MIAIARRAGLEKQSSWLPGTLSQQASPSSTPTITHAHSDHTAGLATLLVSEWEYQRRDPIEIYGSGVEALVNGAIAYLTPNAEIRWAEGKKAPMADIFHGHDVAPGPENGLVLTDVMA